MTDSREKPVLIFDGDCGICRYWVDYWHKLTGDTVEYRPYQEVAADYPDITVDEFRRAIQLIDTDGRVSSGAGATFGLLRDVTPYGLLLKLYRYLPGFAILSEISYTFFSRHRGLLRFLSHVLWGRRFEPPRYDFVSWLFLRLLALIYLGFFISLAFQITGMIGSDGILPLHFFLENVREHFGDLAWLKFPTLFWFNATDAALLITCAAGGVFSMLLLLNRLRLLSLIVLYCLALSLTIAGQHFMYFQWDMLLLETGFLAIFLCTRSAIVVWLYRWLVFRYMFMSGVVKIASRDPTWDNLTALHYHFETQPLPTPLAWYAHHLPDSILMSMTGATLIIELLVPFFLILPRKLRFLAGILFIILQGMIILTGNYNFFNLLTIAMCLFLFDDAAFRWVQQAVLRRRFGEARAVVKIPLRNSIIAACLAVVILSISSAQIYHMFTRDEIPLLEQLDSIFRPLHIVNVYGPFAVMTTQRREINIEGSNDGENWKEYDFRYKPDDVHDITGWIIPHQPRLDWQMWFAALNTQQENPWFRNLMYRLLQGKEDVLSLFAENPFPEKPPVYLRAVTYRYRFTDKEARLETGDWWTREFTGIYFPIATLSGKNK